MDNENVDQVNRRIGRVCLVLCMALVTAIAIAATIPLFEPDFFGSCFEGSCGYMAMFVFAPIATLVLVPVWWLILRRAGPLTSLILWFLLLFVVGHFIFVTVIWLAGLAVLLFLMIQCWQQNKRAGLAIRSLFVLPKKDG